MDPRTSLNQIMLTWRPPKGLESSRPREVCLSGAGRVLASVAVALLLGGFIAGLALYAQASRERQSRMQLLTSGINAEAWITRRWTAGRDPVHYWVEYAYSVDGRSYTGRQAVKRNSWFGLETMRTLKITYLPGNPPMHMVRGWKPEPLPSWASLPMAGVLFFVAWLLSRLLARQRRLLAEGRPAPAIVTRISRTDKGKVVHYVFMSMSGKLVNGKSSPQKNPPPVGSALNVIYEPDQETRNGIYPLSLVKTIR
jgi:hypothetical protein